MDTRSNEQRVRDAEHCLACGDLDGWFAALADDVQWTVMGRTSWSRTYAGKQAVREELLAPLAARFAGPYRRTLQRVFSDGDWVIAQCRGDVTTVDGERYDNEYCFLYRLAEGHIIEIVEYGDTALIEHVLGDRVRRPGARVPRRGR